MTRGIYVGPNYPALAGLCYGMTGEVGTVKDDGLVPFHADGYRGFPHFIDAERVYVPARDRTRYCPKPAGVPIVDVDAAIGAAMAPAIMDATLVRAAVSMLRPKRSRMARMGEIIRGYKNP